MAMKWNFLPLFQICSVLCDLILFMTLLLTRNSAVPLSVEHIVEVLSDAELHIHSALDEAGPSHTFRWITWTSIVDHNDNPVLISLEKHYFIQRRIYRMPSW